MDYLHKTTTKISHSYSTIVVENLQIQNMQRNHYLAKSISDASWGKFLQLLSYKVEETGGEIVVVNPAGTSQKCSGCGETVKKSLVVRVHKCPHCRLELDRDENAARNILLLGDRAGTAQINACGDDQRLSRKQEAAHAISAG